MKNKEYNKWYLVLAIFAVIFTFFGGTLSYWQWTTNESEKTSIALTVTQDFRCDADGGGDITSGEKYLVPTDCTNTDYAIQRIVSVNTELYTQRQNVSLDLWLHINSIGTGLKNSNNFKYALTTNPNSCTNGVVTSGTFKGKSNNSNVLLLDSKSYAQTSSELYYLYIWLDKAETSTSTMNQNFNISLGGECTNYNVDTDLMYNVTNLSNNTNNLDTSFYTLSSYTCENGATLTYDSYSRNLTSSNIDKCNLNFTKQSNPRLYDIVEIGDYISYTGNNGCTGNQCSGWNANQTATDIYDNFGYCNGLANSDNFFYTYGWRVLYKLDNYVYIVSAGSPECVTGTSSDSAATISSLNTATLNYCNTSFLSNGICDITTAHAFNGDDFYKFTSQYYGTDNARYLYSYNDGGTYGTPACYGVKNSQYCGYNNNLVDNGGFYWFGSAFSSVSMLLWDPERYIRDNSNAIKIGVRPVLKLDSSILATGGAGTMDNPYTISTRSGV